MKKYLLFLILLISQASYAEWMQGFYKVTCAPEIRYFEISPAWVSGPNTENIHNRESFANAYNLHYIGKDNTTECILTDNRPEHRKHIKIVGHKERSLFDVYINGRKILEGINLRDDQPISYRDQEKSRTFYAEFLNFNINNGRWSFKTFIKTDGSFQMYDGFIVHIWDQETELPINYRLIEKEFVNKQMQKK